MQQLACQICGRAPAQQFKIRRHVGMLFLQRFVRLNAPLCRDHAIELSKEYLKKTLVQGWWGVVSFFVNWIDVAVDLSALSKAKKMAPPMSVEPTFPPTPTVATIPPPLPPAPDVTQS
ncbi:MAG: hypothetical protein M3P11_05190 [Actinomycetota bacterium]|nr:hypothetical protein [Actinomycetota bacterium]